MKHPLSLLLSLMLMTCGLTTFAQQSTAGKYSVQGVIVDKDNGEAMMGTNVQLLSLPDSTFVTGITADDKGHFALSQIARKNYVLRLSFVGYTSRDIPLNLREKRQRNIDLGYLTLSADAQMLREAEVTAAVAKVQVDGDSLTYNTSAYRVPEGSTIEALIKLLPGAEVDDNGNITINGKTVDKILVDGKEFFLNDKNVALKNISVDMVEKIKSYERRSDLARVTGIDDGEEEMVLDLSVKKGMKNGWFGNMVAGAGTQHRYNNRAMVNRFNDNVQLSVLGNALNVPERHGWWRTNGKRSAKEGGVNFATTSNTLETGGSVRYNYEGTDRQNTTTTENFAAQRGAFGNSRSMAWGSNHGVDANVRLEWKPDTLTNIIFRPNFSYKLNRGINYSSSISYDEDPNLLTDEQLAVLDPVNSNINNSQSYSQSVGANGELQVNRRLNSRGRNLTLRVTGGFSNGSSKQLSAADVTLKVQDKNEKNNRYYSTPSLSYNVAARLSYSEPIADRTYLQFSYRFQHNYSRNDRRAQIYDSQAYQDLAHSLESYRYDIDAILDYMDRTGYQRRDTAGLCQYSEYRTYRQTFGLQFRRVRENYNFSIGIDVSPLHSSLDYHYLKIDTVVERNVLNIAPRINLKWNRGKHTNLQLRYVGRTNQPSMTDLLDITDDSNPLRITKGNPGLKPAFDHNFNGDFRTYNVEAQAGLWSWLHGTVTQNSIAQKTTYDNNGVSTTQPVNIDGNWNVGGGVGYNVGLGRAKRYTIGGHVGGHYSHNVGYYDNRKAGEEGGESVRSLTKNTRFNTRLVLAYRNDWVNVELNGSYNLTHMTNNVNTDNNRNTHNFSYGTNLQLTAPWGTEFATDLAMNSRRGYAQADMNNNELLWNASLSHACLRGKALTFKLEVFDILGQQTNISRAINAFSRTDTRTNGIYQYGLFSVIYRFSIFGGRNTMGTTDERQGDFGGGRRGPGGRGRR